MFRHRYLSKRNCEKLCIRISNNDIILKNMLSLMAQYRKKKIMVKRNSSSMYVIFDKPLKSFMIGIFKFAGYKIKYGRRVEK